MAKDITKTTDAELQKMLSEKRAALRRFRFGITGSKTKNVKEGRTVRRDIARLLTELNRRARKETENKQ